MPRPDEEALACLVSHYRVLGKGYNLDIVEKHALQILEALAASKRSVPHQDDRQVYWWVSSEYLREFVETVLEDEFTESRFSEALERLRNSGLEFSQEALNGEQVKLDVPSGGNALYGYFEKRHLNEESIYTVAADIDGMLFLEEYPFPAGFSKMCFKAC